MLLGTKSGRKISGQLLKYRSIAAVGTVAYQVYRQFQTNNGLDVFSETEPPRLSHSETDQHSRLNLRAMIAAANADGHIDANEMKRIESRLSQLNLGSEAKSWLQTELRMDSGLVPQLQNSVISLDSATLN